MHKDLGKPEYCKHSRNSARGKRGHNRLNRLVAKAIIELGEPESSAPKKKPTKPVKPFAIEVQWKHIFTGKRTWHVWKRYANKKSRDAAFVKLTSKSQRAVYGDKWEYRKVDKS